MGFNRRVKPEEWIGKSFGRLKIVSFYRCSRQKQWMCNCVCRCGNESMVRWNNLQSNNTLSCGCLMRETTAAWNRRQKKHEWKGTKAFSSWCAMFDRCYGCHSQDPGGYATKGVYVCDRWRGIPDGINNFVADMGQPPNDNMSIDRIDNDGPYSPENCRWATAKEQNRNKCNVIWVEWEGKRWRLFDLVESLGLGDDYVNIRSRYRGGWDLKRSIEVPVGSEETRRRPYLGKVNRGKKRVKDSEGKWHWVKRDVETSSTTVTESILPASD